MISEEEMPRYVKKIEAEFAALRAGIGIPAEYLPRSIVFNQQTGIIVVSVQSNEPLRARLFWRAAKKRKYRPIGNPPDDIWQDDVVTSNRNADIYFKTTRFVNRGGDWVSIEQYDLLTRKSKAVLSASEFAIPDGFSKGWVSSLHGISRDDKRLLLRCGFQKDHDSRVHYYLTWLNLKSKSIEIISHLEAVSY